MAQYTHILFDHDGVLVDTEHLYFRATQESLATVDVELTLSGYLEIQAVGGNAWSGMAESGYSEADMAAKKMERNALYQTYLASEDIDIADVEPTLDKLRDKFGLAIVTTAKPSDFDLIHRDRNIVGYMDLVLTKGDYARSKPHPDPYLAALDYFGIKAENALVVEDSERGLKSAVAAGIDCAVVNHPFTAPQDFSAARYRIDRFSGLLELLNV